jgi:hypothetical protein
VRAVAGWAALLALAPAAHAGEIEIDFQSFGSYTTEGFGACRAFVSPPDSGALLSLGPSGVGVQGALGSIADALDGGEALLISFPTDGDAGAVGIWYDVVSGGNQNGMGGLADAFVEAFDAASLSLGVRAVTGVTTTDVSALYGSVPIRSLRLTAAGDSQQIGRLGFRPAPSSATLLQLRGFGAVQAPQFEICDVTIAGSADVALSSTGLGIAGASSPTLLDGFEWVRFDFDRPQHTVFYETEAIADLNASGTHADAFLEGYGANGASLGLVAIHGDAPHDVTSSPARRSRASASWRTATRSGC